MKNMYKALFACILLVSISTPVPLHTAALGGESQAVKAITQEPVEPITEEAVAELVVEGPTKVKAGDLVVISVEKSRAASFKWIVLPSTDNYLVIDGGKRVVFSSGAGGEFRFIVACSLGDTCDVAVHTVTVKGEPATPADNLASRIASWCDQVQSESKRDECLALAQSFSSVAMVMEGGTLTTPSEIVKATFKSNQDALGQSLDNWLPFRNGLAAELGKMSESGTLTDAASHVQVWKAVATALREYASNM
jgi:hypothetical protein